MFSIQQGNKQEVEEEEILKLLFLQPAFEYFFSSFLCAVIFRGLCNENSILAPPSISPVVAAAVYECRM